MRHVRDNPRVNVGDGPRCLGRDQTDRHVRDRIDTTDGAMARNDFADDRAMLVVTAWRHDDELVGVIRWRQSLARGTEEVISVRGLDDLLTSVDEQLRSLSTNEK
jgi:hypothetical protein